MLRIRSKIAGIAIAATALVGIAATPANAAPAQVQSVAHVQHVRPSDSPSWSDDYGWSTSYYHYGRIVLYVYFRNNESVRLTLHLHTIYGDTNYITLYPGQHGTFRIFTGRHHVSANWGSLSARGYFDDGWDTEYFRADFPSSYNAGEHFWLEV